MKAEYDFSKGIKNPYYGKLIKDGKYTVEIEHRGYNEVVECDINTGEKTVRELVVKDSRITVADKRVAI